MSKHFVQWIKSAVTNLIDPERDDRIQSLVGKLTKGLKEEQKAFRIAIFKAKHEHNSQELNEAVRIVYHRLLERVWNDGVVSDKENLQLSWVMQSLGLSESEAMAMRAEFAEKHFGVALAQAMENGNLSSEEEAKLALIAQTVGETLSGFARQFFRKEGEAFLRGIFCASVEDGYLSEEEWESLVSTSHKLGISTDDLLHAVAGPASEFVEHVIADVKAEGRITQQQESGILWLLSTLRIDSSFVQYAREELRLLRCMLEIAEGRLPSIGKPEGIEFRSGEIVHAVKAAKLIVVRHLKSGERREVHHGRIIIMDSRLVFLSDTMAQSVNYRKIISQRGGDDWIDFQVEQKPMWGIRFASPDPIIYPILDKAMSLANQTSVRKGGEERSRHIPRDVRQRVWTRYGGRCAECNANDYLEYDHIIPVAKGGSNADANVQLLCRRCNQKKSDHI